MTPPRRDATCVICGLFACAHLAVLNVTEAMHLHQHEDRPALSVDALPPEPDHAHRDYDRSARIQLTEMAVSGTSSSEWVPSASQQANWTTFWPRDSWHPAYYVRRQIAPLLPPMFTGSATHTSSG